MAAFLNAAAEVLGTGGRRVGAEAWFDALESLSWPKDNFQKFFRVVSIRAISQIVAGTGTKKGMATPSAIDGIGRLPELQNRGREDRLDLFGASTGKV
jgi:hypothetical protein